MRDQPRRRVVRSEPRPLTRRAFSAGAVAAAACVAATARGQSSRPRPLPLENLGLEHLDIVVPDPAASARFYKRVFASALYEQEFRGAKRYFVLFGPLPPDRQVGYLAIGAGNARPVAIGHYCALATAVDLAAVGAELGAAGYPEPRGGFGMIPDPDGLELQLFAPPAGLVTAAVPATLAVEPRGLLLPLGMDHILLGVTDLERSRRYYRFVYGEGLEEADPEVSNRVWFRLARDTRLGIEPAAANGAPGFVRFGLKVAPFDRAVVAAGLRAAGADVLTDGGGPTVLRLRDNDGIELAVRAV